jgi:4-nitrophenyl phosphatase/NagD protein
MNLEKLKTAHCFLLDMDGTVYLGNHLLPGAIDFIDLLTQRDIPFYFLTNNSSRSRYDYAQKLNRLGIDVHEDRIFTSGEATAIYLQKRKANANLYVVGTPSLESEFQAHGLKLVDKDPDFAVLGFDTTLTYQKLWNICNFVRDGVPFIATHPDLNCPTEDGLMPDVGSMIALIETSTGRGPDVIVGKPYPQMVETLVEKSGFSPENIAMVGDRLYTDIALGKAGLTTILVLSGETKEIDVGGSPIKPDFIMQDLAELTRVYRSLWISDQSTSYME